MLKLLAGLAFTLGCCAFAGTGHALEIRNFKSGLVCPDPRGNSESSICFETETVYITGQGSCVFAGEEKSCTWYGFEFDYENVAAEQEISCVSHSSEIADMGNPDEIFASSTATYEYSIKLEAGSGHFYNPQYSVFRYSDKNEPMVHEKTVCSVEDKELFEFEFHLVFPEDRGK